MTTKIPQYASFNDEPRPQDLRAMARGLTGAFPRPLPSWFSGLRRSKLFPWLIVAIVTVVSVIGFAAVLVLSNRATDYVDPLGLLASTPIRLKPLHGCRWPTAWANITNSATAVPGIWWGSRPVPDA